jgi:hypothetical protein
MPNFEVFENRQPRRNHASPTLTIGTRGLISISEASYNLLGKPRAVEFLYDREEQVMALRSVDPDATTHSYAVKAARGSRSLLITGSAFTRHYGISTEPARRRRAELRGDLLCVDMKNPGLVVTSNRARHDEPVE